VLRKPESGWTDIQFDFYEQLRVEKHTFFLLRDALCERNLLQDTELMDVNEQLVIFLHTIGHNLRNRVLQDKFQHSGETISRHFNSLKSYKWSA
jgi:hypothetical protein